MNTDVAARRLGVCSLVLGLTAVVFAGLAVPQVVFLSAIPAVVCGHMARTRFKRLGPEVAGRKIAAVGLVLGYAPLVAIVCMMLLLPVLFGVAAQGHGPLAQWLKYLFR